MSHSGWHEVSSVFSSTSFNYLNENVADGKPSLAAHIIFLSYLPIDLVAWRDTIFVNVGKYKFYWSKIKSTMLLDSPSASFNFRSILVGHITFA